MSLPGRYRKFAESGDVLAVSPQRQSLGTGPGACRVVAHLLSQRCHFYYGLCQRRLRIDDTWFRVELVFFHRRLRCLVVIDLKVGRFSYADAGQMHLYLNYAREHWMKPGENPPVGLILCAEKGAAEAHYALDNLPNKILAEEYQRVPPDKETIAQELEPTRAELERRGK